MAGLDHLDELMRYVRRDLQKQSGRQVHRLVIAVDGDVFSALSQLGNVVLLPAATAGGTAVAGQHARYPTIHLPCGARVITAEAL